MREQFYQLRRRTAQSTHKKCWIKYITINTVEYTRAILSNMSEILLHSSWSWITMPLLLSQFSSIFFVLLQQKQLVINLKRSTSARTWIYLRLLFSVSASRKRMFSIVAAMTTALYTIDTNKKYTTLGIGVADLGKLSDTKVIKRPWTEILSQHMKPVRQTQMAVGKLKDWVA